MNFEALDEDNSVVIQMRKIEIKISGFFFKDYIPEVIKQYRLNACIGEDTVTVIPNRLKFHSVVDEYLYIVDREKLFRDDLKKLLSTLDKFSRNVVINILLKKEFQLERIGIFHKKIRRLVSAFL